MVLTFCQVLVLRTSRCTILVHLALPGFVFSRIDSANHLKREHLSFSVHRVREQSFFLLLDSFECTGKVYSSSESLTAEQLIFITSSYNLSAFDLELLLPIGWAVSAILSVIQF